MMKFLLFAILVFAVRSFGLNCTASNSVASDVKNIVTTVTISDVWAIGTNDGAAISPTLKGSSTISFSPCGTGACLPGHTYVRQFQLKDSNAVVLCTTNAVSIIVPGTPVTPIPPITPPPVPVPPSSWGGTCAGFDNTRVANIDWTSPQRVLPSSYGGGMGQNDALIISFTTGSVSSVDNMLPRISSSEYQGPPTNRQAVLSSTPCDFGTQPTQGASTSGTTVTVPFTVDNPNNYGYYPILKKNTKYYYNIKNVADSCPSGNCPLAVDLSKSEL